MAKVFPLSECTLKILKNKRDYPLVLSSGYSAYGEIFFGRLHFPSGFGSKQVAVKLIRPKLDGTGRPYQLAPRRHYDAVFEAIENARSSFKKIKFAKQGWITLKPEHSAGLITQPEDVIVSQLYVKNGKSKEKDFKLEQLTISDCQKLASDGQLDELTGLVLHLGKSGIPLIRDAIHVSIEKGPQIVIRDPDSLANGLHNTEYTHNYNWSASYLNDTLARMRDVFLKGTSNTPRMKSLYKANVISRIKDSEMHGELKKAVLEKIRMW